MLALEEIEKEILDLPKNKYSDFRKWFLDLDYKSWDKEIEKDSDSGKLDFLMQEAISEKDSGQLRPL